MSSILRRTRDPQYLHLYEKCLSDDTPVLKDFQIFHNYIRPHQGLKGKTPAEACGITVKGENKWITLIQNANQHKRGCRKRC